MSQRKDQPELDPAAPGRLAKCSKGPAAGQANGRSSNAPTPLGLRASDGKAVVQISITTRRNSTKTPFVGHNCCARLGTKLPAPRREPLLARGEAISLARPHLPGHGVRGIDRPC